MCGWASTAAQLSHFKGEVKVAGGRLCANDGPIRHVYGSSVKAESSPSPGSEPQSRSRQAAVSPVGVADGETVFSGTGGL